MTNFFSRSHSYLSLGSLAFAVSATDTDTEDNVALLGLVTQTTGLVWARGARSTVNDIQLSKGRGRRERGR